MKVTVIGGGSSYTPELLIGFIKLQDTLPVNELWLMDIDRDRLQVVGGFAQRMAKASDAQFEVFLTSDLHQAIENTQYVITQFRVGGMEARKNDEYLGRKFGLIGQETTGLGGMAKALRTIPPMLEIAEVMTRIAPRAPLVNFTNPSGLVTQALSKYAPEITVAGVCNGPYISKVEIVEKLNKHSAHQLEVDDVNVDVLGLNHLSWVRGLEYDGSDLWPEVLNIYKKYPSDDRWDADTLAEIGMIPSNYLRYYYYPERMRRLQDDWPPSRAEEVMEIERELLDYYADGANVVPPDGLMKRGGAYYSTVATQLMNAYHNNLGETHIVNVPHRGMVEGWPVDWVLEMPCIVNASGFHPVGVAPLPEVCFGLLAAVKAYEMLTVEAAVQGDRTAAYQALLVHPLGPEANKITDVLEGILSTNIGYLPQF